MSAWIQLFKPQAQPRVRLVCFPHAGGGATAFRLWRERMPAHVELSAVQLPGRGGRLRETPIDSLPALTELITSELLPYLDRPYVFFGHSMGAVLALEVARAAMRAGREPPSHLFLSARRPPHLPRLEPDLHRLPDDAFLKVLGTRFGGVPAEVLQEPELLSLVLPALRADITALETFSPPEAEPLKCAITAYGGGEDRLVTVEQLHAWRSYTSGPFRVRQFPGGHFYLQSAQNELLSDIAAHLAPLAQGVDSTRAAT